MSIVMCLGRVSEIQAYNGSEAAKYGEKYATNSNKEYPYFEEADCTNFVSQCVYAGGISMKAPASSEFGYFDLGNTYETKKYWFCKPYSKYFVSIGDFKAGKKTDFIFSSTWTVVAKNTSDKYWGFYNYMKANGARCNEYSVLTDAEVNKLTSNCQVGDIIQYRSSKSVNKCHSMIVTDKYFNWANKRYEIKVAYHSDDTAPVDLREKISSREDLKKCLFTIISPR